MNEYYRSICIINGKLRKVIVDGYGDIIDNPIKEQIDAASSDPSDKGGCA